MRNQTESNLCIVFTVHVLFNVTMMGAHMISHMVSSVNLIKSVKHVLISFDHVSVSTYYEVYIIGSVCYGYKII